MNNRRKPVNVTIKDVELLNGPFRNFSGEERGKNAAGKRNFCIKIDDDLAEKMKEDGFHIKILQPREEGDEACYFLKINIKPESKYPPEIYLLKEKEGSEKYLVNVPLDNIRSQRRLDGKKIKYAEIRFHGWEYDPNEDLTADLDELILEVEDTSLASAYQFAEEESPEE